MWKGNWTPHRYVTDESNVGFDLLKVTALLLGIILEKETKQTCIRMAQIHPSNVLGFLFKGTPTWYGSRGAPEAERCTVQWLKTKC